MSTVNRWLLGRGDIQLGNFSRVCGRLEDALDRAEAEIFFALAPQFMGQGEAQRLAEAHGMDLASLGCHSEGGRQVTGAALSSPAAPESAGSSPRAPTAALLETRGDPVAGEAAE